MTTHHPVSTSDSLQWGDAFLLGYGPLDEVHKEFVDLVGQLQRAEDADLPELLERLEAHLKHHFDTENGWMVDTAFPPRDCHMDEHAAVMDSVQQVRGLLAQGDVEICRELVAELVRWFPQHADQLDSALAHWMTKRSLGGKPVVVRRGLNLR